MPETNYFFLFEIGSCWPWKQWRTCAIFHSLSSAIYNFKILVFEMTRSHFDTKQIDRGLGGLYTYRWRQRKSGERKEYLPRERSTVKNKEGGGMERGKIIALPLPSTPTVHCSSKSNVAGRINDRELMLARPYKTPALYSFLGAVMMLTPCFKHSIKKYDFCCVFYYFVPHVFLSNFFRYWWTTFHFWVIQRQHCPR